MNNVIFRVDGDTGKNAGLGHIYRTISIYRELKKKYLKKNFLFLTKKNSLGKKIIKKETSEKIINYLEKNLAKTFKLFNSEKDIILIDTFGKQKILNIFLNKIKFKKIISFDNLNDNLNNTNIIFNSIIFFKKKLKNSKFTKVFQGLKYFVFSKKMRSINFKKLKKKKIYKIFISSGGADHKNFLIKVLKILKNFDQLFVYVIIGKGVKKNNPINSIHNSKKIKLIKNSNNLRNYIKKCDICITSGGIVMFECILLSKPLIVYPTYNHQKQAVNFFSKKKSIIYIKKISQLKKIFLKLEKKINYFNKISRKCSSLIDDKGLIRVKNKIIKFIDETN